MKGCVLYYTGLNADPKIMQLCQEQLIKAKGDLELVAVSRNESIDFGDIRKVVEGELSPNTMQKQILEGLLATDADYVFFCEHDVMYHPSHFDFIPPDPIVGYYNLNVFKVRWEDGHALWVDRCIQLSGLCGQRERLVEIYKERVALGENVRWERNWGYEPGTPGKDIFKVPYLWDFRMSEYPNLDIRHKATQTKNRWSIDQFRDKRNAEGWTEKNVSEIKGWSGVKLES